MNDELFSVFLTTPAIGFMLGGLVAAGMFVGGAFALAKFTKKDAWLWAMSLIMYLAFLEGTRFEVRHGIGQDYTLVPVITVVVTLSAYLIGFLIGYCLSKPGMPDPVTISHDDLIKLAEERLIDYRAKQSITG